MPFLAIAERATYELVYVAPARWPRDRSNERQGEPAKAVESYRTVTRLWRDADPAFQTIVADARRRLRALNQGETAAVGAVGSR